MIMTTAELRRHVTTNKTDNALSDMLLAIEQAIKGYTNNSFMRVIAANNGEWPYDIKMGCVKLIEYDLSRASQKAGIAAETLSRHSVTYETRTAENTIMGYPAVLMGFLKPYMRARFGRRSDFR